jgi:hypothetical protein
MQANEAERRRWNDPYWASIWPRREALTSSVTEDLMTALDLQPGESVLDVGSGTGNASQAAARRVGPEGTVTGVDVSAPLVELANRRARTAELAQLRFVLADAQTDAVPGGPFDVAMSQFGVMFFERPDVAFARIGRSLAADGRFGFVCWLGMDENPWHVGHALRGLVPPPPPPRPGCRPTGPFALGDPTLVRDLLAGAGFTEVNREERRREVTVPVESLVDPAQPAVGVAPADQAAARAAVARHLARFADGPDRLRVPLAYQVVTARGPAGRANGAR